MTFELWGKGWWCIERRSGSEVVVEILGLGMVMLVVVGGLRMRVVDGWEVVGRMLLCGGGRMGDDSLVEGM